MRIRRCLALLGVVGMCAVPATGWSQDAASPAARVKAALDAMGGAQALAAIRGIAMKGRAQYWEPEQSYRAGGEMRPLGEADFTWLRDFASGAARMDLERRYVYPFPGREAYSELIAGGAGYVIPRGTAPAAKAMSGVRVVATEREALRSSPLFLLALSRTPAALKPLPDQPAGPARLPALAAEIGGYSFHVLFDPETKLPVRIRTFDFDTIQGDSEFDLVLRDWKAVGAVKIAHRIDMELNGRVVARYDLAEVALDPALPADAFAAPAGLKPATDRPSAGNVPFQWVTRRLYLGRFVDSNALAYDAARGPGLKLVELAPNVQHVVGGTHNSLIVAMKDYLVVFEAPINEWQSRFTIDAAKARYPGKPIKYLVLTHHHNDHTGGSRTYVAEGATVIVGTPNKAHFETVFARPHKFEMDALERARRPATVVEVADRMSLKDDSEEIRIFRIENPHAEGMLIMEVVNAKLGFVTDLWSPGPQKTWGPGPASVLAAVRKAGIAPERFAGGHGAVAPFAELEAMSPK